MVWAAVTETGRSPLLFVTSGVKLNSQHFIADILEDCLLPWAKSTSKELPGSCNRTLRVPATGLCASLQQDSAPSHASKITQSWIQKKIPSYASKEVWPAWSPDLNSLTFPIRSVLETKTCFSPHPTVEAHKAKLVKEWVAISQKTIHAACALFSAR